LSWSHIYLFSDVLCTFMSLGGSMTINEIFVVTISCIYFTVGYGISVMFVYACIYMHLYPQ
jgi:hypothetical protein